MGAVRETGKSTPSVKGETVVSERVRVCVGYVPRFTGGLKRLTFNFT